MSFITASPRITGEIGVHPGVGEGVEGRTAVARQLAGWTGSSVGAAPTVRIRPSALPQSFSLFQGSVILNRANHERTLGKDQGGCDYKTPAKHCKRGREDALLACPGANAQSAILPDATATINGPASIDHSAERVASYPSPTALLVLLTCKMK
jgi:hypothetical protein